MLGIDTLTAIQYIMGQYCLLPTWLQLNRRPASIWQLLQPISAVRSEQELREGCFDILGKPVLWAMELIQRPQGRI